MNVELINLSTHRQNTLFDELKPYWNELVNRSLNDTPFALWEWNKTWWDAYKPGKLWVITCKAPDGKLLGIAPCFIEHHPEAGRIVRFIGHIDVTDYMDFIVDAEQSEVVYRCFADFFSQNRSEFDSLGLANIQKTSPTYTQFGDMLRKVGLDATFEQCEVAPVITLPESYDSYLSDIVASKQRKEIKRKMRHAEGGMYDVEWYIVNETHNLQEEMQRFLALMESADAEKAEFLKNPQHVEFFNNIVPTMAENGWLQLMFITIDGEASAAYLNFDYKNRIYIYNSGLAPDKFGALSPGIVLTQYAIQHAIDTKREVLDFLRGNETYKFQMGGTETQIFQLNAS